MQSSEFCKEYESIVDAKDTISKQLDIQRDRYGCRTWRGMAK